MRTKDLAQRAFIFPQRYEQLGAHWSFVKDGIVLHGRIGPHSVDLSWPWWQPWSLDSAEAIPDDAKTSRAWLVLP